MSTYTAPLKDMRFVLRELAGRPLLVWVYEAACRARDLADVLVATDADEVVAACRERGIPVSVDNGSPYSTDENLWGRSIECGVLEDPRIEPPEEVFEWTTSPTQAPDEPAYLTIRFESGKPVAIDGRTGDLASIIASLNPASASGRSCAATPASNAARSSANPDSTSIDR